MITPDEVRRKAANRYDEFLRVVVAGVLGDKAPRKAFFPLHIRGYKAKKSKGGKGAAETMQTELYAQSKNETGHGYTVIEDAVATRAGGRTTVIKGICFETEKDYLGFIEKEREFKRFYANLKIVSGRCFSTASFSPDYILHWQKKFRAVLIDPGTSNAFWKDIFLCVDWFKEHQRSQLYIREIPLPVHTKFIEKNKALIHSLVTEDKSEGFEKKFGLRTDEGFVRFRSLDDAHPLELAHMDVSDIQLRESDFVRFGKSGFVRDQENIFIIENKMVYLTFPKFPRSLCVWGEGYAKAAVAGSAWLAGKKVYYFGDLDEHGFEILSGFRQYNPRIKSFCMDIRTLHKFGEFRVSAPGIKTLPDDLCLTDGEKEVLRELQADRTQNRLEQERITQDYIVKRLAAAIG